MISYHTLFVPVKKSVLDDVVLLDLFISKDSRCPSSFKSSPHNPLISRRLDIDAIASSHIAKPALLFY